MKTKTIWLLVIGYWLLASAGALHGQGGPNVLVPSYRSAVAVVPSDTVNLTTRSAGLYIGVAGDVRVDMLGSGTVTFKAVPVGVLPVIVKRVYSTGTSATNILELMN